MKRARVCIFVALILTLCSPVAQAIKVKVPIWYSFAPYFTHTVPFEGPGTPPENAFPLVCYVIGAPTSLVMSIIAEDTAATAAAAKGEPHRSSLKENFKGGLPWPIYVGYYVVYEDFNIYYVNVAGIKQDAKLRDLAREKPSINLGVPRRSWHGVLSSLRLLARTCDLDSMVYTLGVPPDPDYVPEIRKSARVSPEDIVNPRTVTFYPRSKDFDATIINPKPGMVFKFFDEDFYIP